MRIPLLKPFCSISEQFCLLTTGVDSDQSFPMPPDSVRFEPSLLKPTLALRLHKHKDFTQIWHLSVRANCEVFVYLFCFFFFCCCCCFLLLFFVLFYFVLFFFLFFFFVFLGFFLEGEGLPLPCLMVIISGMRNMTLLK